MLRLKIRICGEDCITALAIASTGFIGSEPEILMLSSLMERIARSVSFEAVDRILADGTRVLLRRTVEPLEVTVRG